jgi:hypothetical protein
LIGRKLLFLEMPLETSLFTIKNKWTCLENIVERVLYFEYIFLLNLI